MTAIRSILATFMVAISFSILLSLNAAVGIPPSTLPVRLPIGSQEEMLNWIVSKTNGLPNMYLNFTLRFMTTNNGYIGKAWKNGGSPGFDTYQDFINFSKDIGVRCRDAAKATGAYLAGQPTTFVSRVDYSILGGPVIYGLRTLIQLSTLDDITPDSFQNQIVLQANIAIPVAHLQQVRFDIGPPNNCWYTWVNGTSEYSDNWPENHQEQTVEDILVFSSWFTTNRLRGTITAGLDTAVYTGYGDKIAPPVLSITPRQVTVRAPRGADVTIETSTDRETWSEVTSSGVIQGSSSGIYIIPAGNIPHLSQFYRAYCK